MTSALQPGLLVLHGNRLEDLRDVVFDWLARDPLAPLEEEVFLVQSNGAAEWLKMSLARAHGVCAATRVELPGRFLWRTYRQVLGRQRVQPQSALAKEALTWRLMRLLPALLDRPAFAPVAGFLAGGDPERRLQLARRLADLYDQYQVYRADWLDGWEKGRPLMASSTRGDDVVPAGLRWQVGLWEAIVAELTRDQRGSTRTHVHRAYLDAMATDRPAAEPVTRRVVLFGAAQIPAQTLEALAALSTRAQVVLAVPNPCRYHWADIIDGREILRAERHRHPSAGGVDLATLPLESMHLHAHPLLAAWGRQGRDFMRQLDAFDDDSARARFALPRTDLFDDGPGETLLEQVQAAIRDLVPLAEHPRHTVDPADRSIVFQVAHGPQREVEVLHDRLLEMFAAPAATPLQPRDVVVMVPDIEVFAPSIRAVFGQPRRDDPRFVPFDIADLRSRGSNPLVVAVEWLLRIPEKRVRLQEMRDLVDVPAVSARFGLEPDDVTGLFAWLEGAGVRWGLHEAHRESLGLGATGAQNSWRFGLRRLLLGYAAGDAAPYDGIEPYDEVGGLDAARVGAIVDLFERLDAWWSLASTDATPTEWAARCRALLADFVATTDERERLTVAALQAALSAWLESCAIAGFVDAVPLAVLREAWLSGVDGLDTSRRFLTGGVTFCTLMPLRSIPFEVVCLLGMNDGDFPRQSRHDDFDLMALPGQQRPGDRSRRDDDRYLMLEALLSARRGLYISWSGRSARDNAGQPPSVLVAQLLDYLSAGWRSAGGGDVVAARTTEHPLQPFSRCYFEATGPTTYAREWQAAHRRLDAGDDGPWRLPPFDASDVPLTIRQLTRFMKNPVAALFRTRLDVVVPEEDERGDDDEPFDLEGLARYGVMADLLDDPQAALDEGIAAAIRRRLQQVRGSGRLPMFESGRLLVDAMSEIVADTLGRWVALRDTYPQVVARRALRLRFPEVAIDDWLEGLRTDGEREVSVVLTPSKLIDEKTRGPRRERLLEAWIRMLVAVTCDRPVPAFVVGPDATLALRPLDRERAARSLADVLDAWRQGMTTPLPFALRTALARLDDPGKARGVYEGDRRSGLRGDVDDFCLQRAYPDFASLEKAGLEDHARGLFEPMLRWIRNDVELVAQDAAVRSGAALKVA